MPGSYEVGGIDAFHVVLGRHANVGQDCVRTQPLDRIHVFQFSRAMFFQAALPGVGHGLDASEAVVLWDISNSVAVVTWTAIGMFMLPVAVVALRRRALPLWLGVVTAIIAVANLVFGWLPPGGPSSPGEFAFLFWVPVTSVVLFFWRPLPARA